MLSKVITARSYVHFFCRGSIGLTTLGISSFTADPAGGCTSFVQTYSVPSEYCVRLVGDGAGGDFVNTTLSIWGTTLTGSAYSFAGSGTITTVTETLETPTASTASTASTDDYVGVSVVAMLYLVHNATETAGGISSPTSSSTSLPSSAASMTAKGPQLASVALIVSTMAVAFTSGFMLMLA